MNDNSKRWENRCRQLGEWSLFGVLLAVLLFGIPFLEQTPYGNMLAKYVGESKLLDTLESISILVAIIYFFKEAPERKKRVQYEAWHLINSAQGQGGGGGRKQALESLHNMQVSLSNITADNANLAEINLWSADLIGANLQKSNLQKANLRGAKLHEAKLQDSDLSEAQLQKVNLTKACLQRATLIKAKLQGAKLFRANLQGANLFGAELQGAILLRADFRGALNLSPEQVKCAQYWHLAIYENDFRRKLGLTPEESTQTTGDEQGKEASN